MSTSHPRLDRRELILDVAERLFRERGLKLVSLLDIAREVGIRKPSIYHHFPGGKEELYVAVHRRMFDAMGAELHAAMAAAESGLDSQLRAAASWLLGRPPVFLLSMIHHDMPELSPANRAEMTAASYGALMQPLVAAATSAAEHGEMTTTDPHALAGAFLAILEGNTVAAAAGFGGKPVVDMMSDSIDLLLYGALPR